MPKKVSLARAGKAGKVDAATLTNLEQQILLLRGQKVMLSTDLAMLYEVEPRVLNQAVKRSIERFPEDFMFQLTQDELANLKSQSVISSWGGSRALPYAFTEQGVAMLSSVLNSPRAVQVNIAIMRAFVKLRKSWLPIRTSLKSSSQWSGNTTHSSKSSLTRFVNSCCLQTSLNPKSVSNLIAQPE